MTLEQAINEVTLSAQTDADPSLTADQVSAIVVKNMRAQVWQAAHAYKIGDRVQPTVPNGHFYRRIFAGLSPAGEPVWTLKEGGTVFEGETQVWVECGIDLDGNLYNVRNAIYECWQTKAAMAAKQFDVSIADQKWHRSQIYEHCLEMARAWSPLD